MHDKQGVTPIGWEDTRTRGGCILNQLLIVLTKRVKIKSSGSRSGGGDTRKIGRAPMFTMEELSTKFQACFDELYPGRTAIVYGPKTIERTVAERREFNAATDLWRTGLGKRPLEEVVDEDIPVRAA
jgi:hypothetical protein